MSLKNSGNLGGEIDLSKVSNSKECIVLTIHVSSFYRG